MSDWDSMSEAARKAVLDGLKPRAGLSARVPVRGWRAPNFAVSAQGQSVPVAALEIADLDALAGAWIEDLYAKAGKTPPSLVRDGRRSAA